VATKHSTIDSYINSAAEFAKPILTHLRQLVHKACPEVQETIKWGFPHFDYKGILCSMAAFKNHCAFGFWKSSIMNDKAKVMSVNDRGAMGNFERITSLSDLPSDKILLSYIREAMSLNEGDVKMVRKKKAPAKDVAIPSDLVKALKTDSKARGTFENFSHSHKREYVEWIEEAKTDITRQKRIVTAIEWMADGKSKNWKYMKK
jgi:uncharacterized protein YdeI (YjbR/CyaY-like superfamily)